MTRISEPTADKDCNGFPTALTVLTAACLTLWSLVTFMCKELCYDWFRWWLGACLTPSHRDEPMLNYWPMWIGPLVEVVAWCIPGNKPSRKPMLNWPMWIGPLPNILSEIESAYHHFLSRKCLSWCSCLCVITAHNICHLIFFFDTNRCRVSMTFVSWCPFHARVYRWVKVIKT